MTKINILRPPKVNVDSRRGFWKQIVMIIVGTTISLAFTITAASGTVPKTHKSVNIQSSISFGGHQ